MAIKNELGELISKTTEAVKLLKESGATEELVLVLPSSFFFNWHPSLERVKEQTGVDYVEEEPTMGGLYEAVVMQRSEYLRMFIKSLGERGEEDGQID